MRQWRCVVCYAEGEDEGTANLFTEKYGHNSLYIGRDEPPILHWPDGRNVVACQDHPNDIVITAVRLKGEEITP